MGKVKYPNPKFFKAKDRMDWAAQAENLKLVGGIFWDMFKETDWKKFGEGWKNILISDRDRIKEEYKAFAAASMKDKIDLILNGERHLGRLYRDGAMCTVRREWRGIKDTVYDFYEWARLWGMLLMSFSKDLIPAMNQTLYYRWMVSYFCCHSFMDKNILGLRGSNLRMSHELTYCIYRYVAENLVILAKGDKRNGNCDELNSKLVLIDEMTMAQIMARLPDPVRHPASVAAGVPGLRDRPAHLHPVHRRRRVLRSPGRYLPGSDVRVRRARHRRPAASGQLLHLQLHAV